MNENINNYQDAASNFDGKGEKRSNSLQKATFIISLTALILTIVLILSLLLGIFPSGVGRVLIIKVSDSYNGSEGREKVEEMLEEAKRSVVVVSATKPSGIATGAGVILTDDGYIVTNHHVIEDAISVSVTLFGEEFGTLAEVVASNEQSDVALLKIDAQGLIPATFTDSSQCRVGERVYAIGNPASTLFSWSVSEGIISGLDRTIKIYNDGKLEKELFVIQTDAAVSTGSSGGPLINASGQVIGIVTLKLSEGKDLGFAIGSNEVIAIIEEILKQ